MEGSATGGIARPRERRTAAGGQGYGWYWCDATSAFVAEVTAGHGPADRTLRRSIMTGASMEAPGIHGWKPLHEAAHNGHVDVAALLLDKGMGRGGCGATPD
jgi:hypothetical protein